MMSPQSHGQNVLEEIIVTAQKRDELLQDVAMSVQVLSGEFLKEQGISDLQDATTFLPNVIVTQGENASLTVRARGIATGGTFPGSEQSVAVFNDGLYYGRSAMAIAGLFDMAQVEALMGPQPVYFGQSAIAGLISYRSQRPTPEPGGYALVEAGSQNQMTFEGAAGGGVGENTAIRVAGRYQENDGWLTRFADGQDANASEDWAVRASLVSDITDSLYLFAKTELWEQTSNGGPLTTIVCAPHGLFCNMARGLGVAGDFYVGTYTVNTGSSVATPRAGLPPPFRTVIDINGLPEMQTDTFGNDADGSNSIVEIQWEIGEGLLLTSLTGYAEYSILNTNDLDATPMTLFGLTRPEEYEQASQEIRLQSTGDGDVQWLAGLYWQDHEIYQAFKVFTATPIRGPAGQTPSDFRESSTYQNVFGSLSWALAEDWTFDLGARYTDVGKSALSQNLSGDVFDSGGNVIDPRVGGVAVRAGEPYIGPNFQCMGIDPRSGEVCRITQDFGRTFIDAPLQLDDEEVTYQAALSWDAGDAHSLWVRYAKGYKPGGFASGQAAFALPSRGLFDAEEAVSTEFGGHFGFLDDRLRFNAAIYHTEYTDQQVNQFVINPVTGNANLTLTNAGASTIDGIEADVTYLGRGGLILSASIGTMNGEYDMFVSSCTEVERQDAFRNTVAPPDGSGGLIGQTGAAGCRIIVPSGRNGEIDRSGTEFNGLPDWTASLRASRSWDVGGNLMLTLSVAATLHDDWDDTSAITEAHRSQDGFSIVNANVGVGSRDGAWLVSVYGRNITDEWYWLDQPTPVTGLGTSIVSVMRPQSWGAQFRYNFGGN